MLTGQPLPIKYDLLNGRPIRDTTSQQLCNMFIPVPLNLDHSPGKEIKFDSGYDLRILLIMVQMEQT